MLGLSLEERRQQNRDAVSRPSCDRCGRPAAGCYCAHLTRIETRTRVVLLQHPREQDVAIGTARMASLCLAGSELHVVTEVDPSSPLAASLRDPARPAILLYPGDDSIDVRKSPPEGPVTLVVVDGTWSQTKKMVRRNPVLASLPRYAFVPDKPSEYRIRKEPTDTCVATIEALVHVLSALEGDRARFEQMLHPFRAMIDFQIACQDRLQGARLRHPKKPRPEKHFFLPPELRERREDLLCIVGEANSWPYALRARDPSYVDEIIQWTAFRPATGETFSAIAAPRRALSPNTARHADLPEALIVGGVPLAELHDSFRAFLRESDVLCSWGRYETSLFAVGGGPLPTERLDLRQLARVVSGGKVGTLEQYSAPLPRAQGVAETIPGRARRKLVGVTRVLAELVRLAG